MIKLEHTVELSPDQMMFVIEGMRNPMNSWDKSDSYDGYDCKKCGHIDRDGSCKPGDIERESCYKHYGLELGPNDKTLMKKLAKAGTDHRKFMRMMPVYVRITAPLYWWKEFDTYKVGTTANSTSTMHKLASTPITAECFEIDDCNSDLDYDGTKLGDVIDKHIEFLESMRVKYLETKDKAYWKELIRWLPSAWQHTRTVTMTYENLLAMCSKGQRRFHKLTEWSKSFIDWARTLPYAQELIFPDETE